MMDDSLMIAYNNTSFERLYLFQVPSASLSVRIGIASLTDPSYSHSSRR